MHDRIHQNHAALVSFLRRRAPGREEELAQEVWFRLARAKPEFDSDAQFRAYTYAVARRILIDHHRRRAARVQLVPIEGNLAASQADVSHSPYSRAVAGEVLKTVEACLASMKVELAQVFRWRTTEDVSFKDIAARQGVSLNTALGRMHQATTKIRAALTAEGLIDHGARS